MMSTKTPVNDDNVNIQDNNQIEKILNNNEKDTLGEIGNICMGTSATTLSTLLGKRVNITTPKVSICKGCEYLDEYEKPVVATNVSYTEGLDGKNVFLLKKEDALLITNLLMGNEGEPGAETEELFISAISEVMNQMVGSSSTALADILHVGINISPPVIKELTKGDKDAEKLFIHDEISIKISFKMEIDELLVSNIMQIMPYEFGKKLVCSLNNNGDDEVSQAEKTKEKKDNNDDAKNINTPSEKKDNNDDAKNINTPSEKKDSNDDAKNIDTPSEKKDSNDDAKNIDTPSEKKDNEINLKAVKYQSFNNNEAGERTAVNNESKKNIDLIMDVPLQVTVVLGKSKKSIKEILNLNMGSIIVLDRLAGEMVDVLVNGKLFARGEVVVIDDNYGVRITEITASDYKSNLTGS